MILLNEERLKLQKDNVIGNGARLGFLQCTQQFINLLKF